ncbi:RNA 2',3'-cyclic phosphodiesterase [Pseudomonas segetis]|uniref:RNA 2',3'-cyclic phosphodiesterase n=1 Tax=Pseudomonas segetis TaxID=298908 RepID=A0A239DLH7_9PSED|nr:RNA 2',3'-cyclic phosphodiesterase [Pseudomonas segetis]SNS32543.1 2'-5' RNA ligase [Pseudomonas segetis]
MPLLNAEPSKRLFFALPCSAVQRSAISQWRRHLQLRSGRPVVAENFHLTLAFLGAVPVSMIGAICAAIDHMPVSNKSMSLCLDTLDVWRQSNILLLAPQDPPPALGRLVYALEQALLPFGLVLDKREFRAHLTLSRDYRMAVPEAVTPPEFWLKTDHFVLYESHKGRYRALAQWPL